MKKILLHNFVSLVGKIANIKYDGYDISGTIVADTSNIDVLKQLYDYEILVRVKDGSARSLEELSSSLPATVEVWLSPKRLSDKGAHYFEDLSGLIQACKVEDIDPYYVASLGYYSDSVNIPKPIKWLVDTLTLHKVLDIVSDHKERNADVTTFIFLQKTKLDIIYDFDEHDIVDLVGVSNLYEQLQTSADKGQIRSIFKAVIIESLINENRKDRFKFLLKNFEHIYDRYEANYSLYLSDISFDELEKKYEERKVDFVSKINNVVSDIHNKVIAIPISFLIIAGQMEKEVGFSVKNTALLGGGVLFAVISLYFIHNQKKFLEEINSEIDYMKREVKNKSVIVYNRLEPKFIILDKTYKRSRRMYLFVSGAILFVLFTTVFLYIYIYNPHLFLTFYKEMWSLQELPAGSCAICH